MSWNQQNNMLGEKEMVRVILCLMYARYYFVSLQFVDWRSLLELKVSVAGLNCQVYSAACSHYINTAVLSFEDIQIKLNEDTKRQE